MTNGKNRDVAIIAGVTFMLTFALPVLDGLANMATSAINKTINKWSLDMQLDQREAEVAAETISPSPSITQAVGFNIESPEYGGYDYE